MEEAVIGKIDPSELFMAMIAQAVKAGKDPTETLVSLANEGAKFGLTNQPLDGEI